MALLGLVVILGLMAVASFIFEVAIVSQDTERLNTDYLVTAQTDSKESDNYS